MREVVLFSMLSFVVIFLGVFYVMGFVHFGPPQAAVEQISRDPSTFQAEMKAIEKERSALEKKRREVQIALDDLIAEKKMIEVEREKLGRMMKRIEALAGKLDEEEAQKVAKLAKLYESMKPNDAAKIASSLDLDLLTNIIASMKEKQAAKMLSALPPKQAARISKKLGLGDGK